MLSHPTRYYGTRHLHFINCSCYHRQPWLARPQRRDLFLRVLEQVRQRYGFVVVGYVVMPEHIHLPISEPGKGRSVTSHAGAQARLRRAGAEGIAEAASVGAAGDVWRDRGARLAAAIL